MIVRHVSKIAAYPPVRIAAAVLAVTLLLAQLGLITHAADHALYGDDAACVACVHAQTPASGASVPSTEPPLRTFELPINNAATLAVSERSPTYCARAPPVFS